MMASVVAALQLHQPPHIAAASNARTGAGSTSAPRILSCIQGWRGDKDLNINPKAASTRRCANPQCTNMLDITSPSKRCVPCCEAALREKVNVPCSSCHVIPLSVTVREAMSGAQFICGQCWKGMNMRIPGPVSMVRRGTQGMPPPPPPPHDYRPIRSVPAPPHTVSSVSTHTPPSMPSNATPRAPPSATMAAPQELIDVFENIKKFVHPDHRHILERRDEHVPLSPVKPVPLPSALTYDEARRRAQSVMPHYGIRGEILADTPDDLQRRRTAPALAPSRVAVQPPMAIQLMAQEHRTPFEVALSVQSTLAVALSTEKTATVVREPARQVSETNQIAHPDSATAKSSELEAPPLPIRKKRKRAPTVAVERVCATPKCSRTIPPRFQGVLCVQCGFARWHTQFRERFSGLPAELSAKESKNKENKALVESKEPVAATVVDAPDASITVGDAITASVAATLRQGDVADPKADNVFDMPPEQPLRPAEGHADAMDVDSDSADDRPLSARSRPLSAPVDKSYSAMAVDPLTSDDDPLSAMVAHNDNATSDEEPLSAMIRDYASSDEEPLAKTVSAKDSSTQKLSDTHSSSVTSSYSPLRIVIPPVTNRPPLHIRRVRLILGPRPHSPETSSSSRESSPERSSAGPPALRRRTSSAVDRRWHDLGWDSDESELTPLEETTDEGESEIDPAESDDEATGPAPSTAAAGSASVSKSFSSQDDRPHVTPGKKHCGLCATTGCSNLLAPGWKWKSCDVCRLRTRIMRKQQRRAAAAQSREAFEEFELPVDGDFSGWHKCSRKSCKRMLPEQYKWKRCPRCRADGRKYQAMLRYGPNALPDDEALLFAEQGSSSCQQIAPQLGVRAVGAVGSVAASTDKHGANASKTLDDLPPYQHFAALLGTVQLRFDEFRAAQIRYVQLKALQEADRKPMMFSFDGEYSIVADPSGGSVDAIVNTVIRNLSVALDLVFTLVGLRPGPEDSIAAALRCLYRPHIPALKTKKTDLDLGPEPKLEIRSPHEAKTGAVVEVVMTGDLEVGVAWDRRHKFFPGQRIMVRFRLVG